MLKESWKDEIKILSCQPGELSLEGKQWGGGRGLFSYELINGMAGLADKNNDGIVSLRELNLYLMDKIPDGANPLPQNPMLSGNMAANISQINKGFLASISSHSGANMLASIDIKGMDESLLKGLDDSIKENYLHFKLCLDTGNLFNNSKEPSANYYYDRIPGIGMTSSLKALMTRNFSVAIVQDLDSNLIRWANNRPFLSKMGVAWFGVEAVKLRQMLGDKKLKQLGFFSKALCLDAIRGNDIDRCIRVLDTCIAFADNEAFTYTVRGHMFRAQKRYQEAINDYHQALTFSPGLFIPQKFLGVTYIATGKYDSAIIAYNKIKVMFNDWRGDAGLVLAYYHLNRLDSMNLYLERILADTSRYKDTVKIWRFLGNSEMGDLFVELHDCSRAAEFYDKASAILPGFQKQSSYNTACCYSINKERSEALKYFEEALKGGWDDLNWIVNDTDLDPIRQEPEFKELMKKYFPDKYKD